MLYPVCFALHYIAARIIRLCETIAACLSEAYYNILFIFRSHPTAAY